METADPEHASCQQSFQDMAAEGALDNEVSKKNGVSRRVAEAGPGDRPRLSPDVCAAFGFQGNSTNADDSKFAEIWAFWSALPVGKQRESDALTTS